MHRFSTLAFRRFHPKQLRHFPAQYQFDIEFWQILAAFPERHDWHVEIVIRSPSAILLPHDICHPDVIPE
jgi:hypothetical protein